MFENMEPTSASLSVGEKVYFKSMLNGSDVTQDAVWTVGEQSIASVAYGLVTGLKAGTTVVSAAYGGLTGSAVLTVKSPVPPGGTSTYTVEIAVVGMDGELLYGPGPVTISAGSRWGMVGSTAALVSNFFLGHGPWTLWQMLGWGLAGISAGLLRKLCPRIGTAGMTLFCFAWGYLYGWIINLWFWTGFLHPLNWESLLAACAASFWFDTLHALGNAVFYLTLGHRIIKILERFRKKITFTPLTKQPAGGEHHRDESMRSSQLCR